MLGTLGNLDGDLRGDGILGRRGRTRSFHGDLAHDWRRTGEMDLSMMTVGHWEELSVDSRQRSELPLFQTAVWNWIGEVWLVSGVRKDGER